MSTPKKEIIKAIYIRVAKDSLEFVTIASKEELQSKKDKVKLLYPTHEIVVKTFASIEAEETIKFYKFNCEVINGNFIARCIPCSKTAVFCIRHIPTLNQVVITISANSEDEAFYKAHDLYNELYIKKYIK